MGAGGIIQNHAKALLPAVLDPSIYEALSETDKDVVEQISAKAFHDRNHDDVRFLVEKIREVCC